MSCSDFHASNIQTTQPKSSSSSISFAMDDQPTSCVRRVKFSHTICHRLDSSKLSSHPFTDFPKRTSQPAQPANAVQIQKKPTTNRPRTVSRIPQIKLYETFKEARSTQRRFSTPTPRRKSSFSGPKSPRSSSLMKYLAPKRKESSWSKYFDHSGGKVTSVETADENMVDLSNLFLGNKFAHGSHSRLY